MKNHLSGKKWQESVARWQKRQCNWGCWSEYVAALTLAARVSRFKHCRCGWKTVEHSTYPWNVNVRAKHSEGRQLYKELTGISETESEQMLL